MAWVTSTSQFWRPEVKVKVLADLISCTICSGESVLYIILGFWWSAGNFGVSWLIEALPQSLYTCMCMYTHTHTHSVFGSDGKESACNAGDPGLIPGSGRSPRDRNGNPLQHSGLQNSNRGAWWAQSMGSQRVQCNWATNAFTFHSVFGFSFSIHLFIYLTAWHLSCSMWHLRCTTKDLSL